MHRNTHSSIELGADGNSIEASSHHELSMELSQSQALSAKAEIPKAKHPERSAPLPIMPSQTSSPNTVKFIPASTSTFDGLVQNNAATTSINAGSETAAQIKEPAMAEFMFASPDAALGLATLAAGATGAWKSAIRQKWEAWQNAPFPHANEHFVQEKHRGYIKLQEKITKIEERGDKLEDEKLRPMQDYF